MTTKIKIEQVLSESTEQMEKEVRERDIHEIRRIAVEMMQKTKIF